MARRDKRRAKSAGRQPLVEELEPRLLFSADAAALVADASLVVPVNESTTAQEVVLVDETPAAAQDVAAESLRHELVFVDAGVEGHEALVEDLRAGSGESRSLDVVVLDPDRSGIEQISEALASHRYDLDAVHIVSHGTEGAVQLGNTWLSNANVGQHAQAIAGWGAALGADADLLIYGCDLAGSGEGLSLVNSLAALTGADVASSIDDTGAAILGGDWELEHEVGHVETAVAFSAEAQASWVGVLDGTAIWSETVVPTPQTADFDGNSFGTESNTANVGGPWRTMQGAESPTRDEKIVVGVENGGGLSGQMWNGSSWTAFTFNDLATVGEDFWWSVDVAYESQSGDAVLVYTNGATGTNSLSYRTWNGSTWSGPTAFSAGEDSEARQIQLAASPDSDEMVLVMSNQDREDVALVWNGSSWGNQITLDTSATDDRVGVFVAYEQQSGDALVSFGKGGDDVFSRTWNGSTWSGESTATAPGTISGDVRWTTLASDPQSDRIALGVLSTSNEVWVSVWNGSSWDTSLDTQSTTDVTNAPNVAVAFESTSGQAIATYGQGDNKIYYRTWTSSGGWSAEAQVADVGHKTNTMMLWSRPGTDQVMLGVQDDDNDVTFILWDGRAWGAENEVENESGEVKNQPFLFLWDQDSSAGGPGQTAFWISTDADENSGGGAGLNGWTEGEALAFGDPDLELEPVTGTTSGTLMPAFDLDDTAFSDGDTDIDALHYVTRDLQVGSSNFQLYEGDLLFSTQGDETLTGIGNTKKEDVIVFRPTIPGDYTAGTFLMLLEKPAGVNVQGISLVEQNTLVGDITLQAGDFLIAVGNKDLRLFETTDVGAGSTSGTASVLLRGGDSNIGVGSNLAGVDLVEEATTVGGHTIAAGTILLTMDGSGTVGSGVGASVDQWDIFGFDVSATTLVAGDGNGSAAATLLLDGQDVGLSANPEKLRAVTTVPNNRPPVVTLAGPLAYTENDGAVVVDGTGTATDADGLDFLTGTLTVDFTVNGTANDRLSIRNQGSGAGQVGVSGSNVSYEGTVVGTFAGGTDGSDPLVVTFDADADEEAVQAVLRNVTYENVSEDPATAARTLRFVLTDGDGGTSDPATVTVNVTAQNDPPALANNSLTIDEGQTVILGSGDLLTNDVDHASGSLTYTVSGVNNGQFELVASPGSPIASFTQAQVNASQVQFVHDGNEAAPTYSVTVSDGSLNDGPEAAAITFTNLNDAPTLANNSLTIDEGQTVVLGSGDLLANDPDHAPGALTYTVSGLSGGQFELVASPGSPITSFTQAQVNAGQVQFVHDGNEAAPTYSVTASDGSLSDGPAAAAITFTNQNDAPALANNSLTIDEGQTVVLGSGDLLTNDPDHAPGALTYTVSGLSGGQFELVASPGSPITSFTQAQINAGQVQFVHNGGEAAPTYSVSVSDGSLSDGPAAAAITFTNLNDAPTLANNSLTINEGQTVVLGSGDLLANDPDHAPGALTYTVSGLSGGQFELVASPGSPITSFTQAQVNAGQVQFVHDGNEAAPTYSVTVSDGGLSDGPAAAAITFTNQNDAPALANYSLTIDEGQTVVLGSGDLLANDPDHAPGALTYTVSGLSDGQFELVASPGSPITSFTQAQVNAGQVQFVHNGGEAAPTYSVSVSDGSLNDGPAAATITFTNLNDAPALANNSLTIDEGQTVVLGSGDLLANDPDHAPGALTYTVSGLSGGQFELVASPGSPITSFTQAQVNAGQVQFVHDGNEAAPTYSMSVSDGSLSDGPAAAAITFNGLNDAPVIANNSLTIDEGQTVVLGSGDLLANDPDHAPGALTYTVSGLSGGQFELVASPGSPITSFTQAQVNAGQVQFVHDGNEAAPTYSVSVSDGSLSNGPTAAAITFTNLNDAPVIANNSLTLNEGQTVVLGSGNLLANDPDHAPGALTYTVSGLSGGQFELVASPGSPITSFTQAQVNAGQVQFVHDDNEAAPTYSVTVSDGSLSDGPAAAAIIFTNLNDAPVIANNSLALNEGQSVVLGSGDLLANDPDHAPGALSYTVSGLSGGQFELVASPGSPITSFTQAQVNAGQVQFVHNGGEVAPTYSVTVSDGSLSDGPAAAAITFTNLNDAPTLANNSLTINEGQTVVLGSGDLLANDPDHAPAALIYTVSGLGGGQFELVASPGSPITSFTQAQVNAGQVQFVHNGGEAAPTYSVSVSDGSLSDGPAAAAITFNGLNDAPVIANNSLTLNEGQTVVLGSSDLLANDPDHAPGALTYTVSGLSGGQFELVASPGSPITSFTQAQVNAGQVQFVHDGNEAAPTYSVSVSDGFLSDGPQAAAITFTNLNDAPVVDDLDSDTLAYFEGSGPLVIDQGTVALVSDPDSANFNGGELRLSIVAGNDPAEDVLSIQDVGTGAGQIGFSGGIVTYEGTTIGTAVGGTGGADLVISLNLSATPTAISALARNITYENTDAVAATLGSRTVEFRFDDGDTGLTIVDTTVTVFNSNVSPTITGTVASQAVNDNATRDPFTGVTVGDADVPTQSLTVTVTLDNAAKGVLTNLGSFVDLGGGAYRFNGNAGAATTAIRALTFDPAENRVAVGNTETTLFTISVSDGIAAQVDNSTTTVDSTSINDAPTLGSGALAAVLEDTSSPPGATVATLFGAGFSDVDVSATLSGVAIVGNTSPLGEGVWEYSSDGTNWYAVGTVDDAANALAVDAASLLRFVPAGDYNGVPTDLVVRGLDDTHVGFSTTDSGENRITVNTSSPGGNSAIAAATSTLSTSITADNDAPAVGFNSLTISEGGSVILSTADLSTTDVDSPATALTYTVSGLSGGQFELVASPGSPITSFTQDDVDTGKVRFVHDGGEAAPAYSVTVSDGFLADGPSAATITFTNVNDAPNIATNSLTISEGQTVVLGSGDLSTTDVDSPATALTYTVTAVTGGQFELVASPGSPIVNFTQDDVDTGKVQFVHGGSEAAPTYSLSVSDGFLADGPVAATITFTNVNDAPTLGNNALIISESGTVLLGAGSLSATDPDDTAASLSFTVSAVSFGQFERVSVPGVAITSFLQSEVTSGDIRFIHDGGEAAPSYSVSVSDGSLSDGPAAAAITFTNVNDAPSIATNSLTINEGQTVVLGSGDLATSDVDSPPASLTYTVSGLSGGRFELVASPGSPITSFTQAQVTAGQVQFVHNGGETAPAYSVSVSDGSLSDGPAAATITFTNLNDGPVIANNSLTVAEGQTVVLGSGDLLANDPDTAAGSLTYTVSGLSGGQFELVASPGSPITSFTQAQVSAGQVQFVHDGGEAAPTYSVSVSDGSLSDGPAGATITFTNVNDGPVLANNSLTVAEGQTVVLGSGDLLANDPDTAAGSLTYTVSGLSGGQFELVASPGSPITSFTQAQVSAGQVQFVHNGGETAPAYSVSVSDGSLSDGPAAATITFTNVNDGPVLANNSLTVAEGQTLVLGGGDLLANDPDTAAGSLTYTVSGLSGGQFELVASPGSPITAFTQAQVNAGQVQFVHDGNEAAPAYSVSVSDGSLSDGPAAATITFTNVNDGPVLANNSLTVAEGQTVVLGSGDLLANDPDHAPGALTYTVTGVVAGRFELVASPGSPIASFTQAQVSAGQVQFVHNGGETAPAYSVSVSDGSLSDGPQAATITYTRVNDAPTITGTASGQALTDKSVLSPFAGVTIGDVDLPADTLTVDVVLDDAAKGVLTGAFTSLGGGVYRFTGDAASATAAIQGLSFDPTENRVAVGSTESTTFTIQVDDGSAPLVVDANASAVATSLNDAPIVSDVNLTVSEDATAGTLVGSVVASDPDPGDVLGYSFLSGNLGGAFAIDPATGAITVADPAAIDFEVNPAFNLTVQVQDASLATDTGSASVAVGDVAETVPPPDGGLPDPDPVDDPPPDDDPAPEDEGEEQRVDAAAPPSQVNGPLVAPPSGLAFESQERDRSDVGLAYELARPLRTGGDAGALLTAARLGPAGDGFALDGALMRALDLMGIDMGATAEEEQQQLRLVLGVAEGGAAAMLAGFLTWFLRGGTLLTSLLSTLPIWSRIDPLPVLNVASANQAPIPTDEQDEEEREAGRILDDSQIPDADPMGPMPQPPSGI